MPTEGCFLRPRHCWKMLSSTVQSEFICLFFVFRKQLGSLLKLAWCLTSTETTRLIRDGEKGGEGGMEEGEEGDYIPLSLIHI